MARQERPPSTEDSRASKANIFSEMLGNCDWLSDFSGDKPLYFTPQLKIEIHHVATPSRFSVVWVCSIYYPICCKNMQHEKQSPQVKQWRWFCGPLTFWTKIQITSNPENKTRERRVSPADKGAAGFFQWLPGVFQWPSLMLCKLSWNYTFKSQLILSWTASGSLGRDTHIHAYFTHTQKCVS